MSESSRHLRTIAALHPTFEAWGGAEWTLHGMLQALTNRFGIATTLITHRYAPIAGERPDYDVVEHRSGGEVSGPRDWAHISRLVASRVANADAVMVHNHPAAHWLQATDLERAAWYCHEPPRRLYGPHERLLASEPGAGHPARRAAAALRAYGVTVIPYAFRRWRLRRDIRRAGVEAWSDDLRARDGFAIRNMAAIAANSRFSAERVQEIYGRDARVIHPVPADLATLTRTVRDKERIVLWVGRLSPLKRPLEMLAAWRMACRNGMLPAEDWTLVIVGRGPLSSMVRREASNVNAAQPGSIIVKDRLPREELIDLYARASLTVHTALAEPFGLVPLESMSCGTAVLAHDEGGVRETMTDAGAGWLRPLPDAERLADELGKLLASEPALEQAGQTARAAVTRTFDFERSIDELVNHLSP